jgi:hypothetical protein
MRPFPVCLLSLLVPFLGLSVGIARAESTRPTYPSVVGIEALGRASSASIFFDRMLDEDFGAGVGFGGGSISMVPVYANYYFSKEQGSLYGTAGVSLVLDLDRARGQKSAAAEWQVNESVIPVLGLGYENRSDQGYLFRATGYVAYADKTLKPWGGVSLGYAF